MTIPPSHISAFNGVTLSNGTTRRALDLIRETGQPQSQIITLPNGQKLDQTPSGTTQTIVPGKIKSQFLINEGTAATNRTTYNAIAAKLGTYGTLTLAERDDVNTYTANARLVAARNVTTLDEETLTIELTFDLLSNPV